MKVYRIKDWGEHFEKNRTKELKFMTWVPFPNKHDGDGYTELLEHPEGASHYGAWCAIVQVASKCDPRGTLLRDGRRPHTAASLARITRIPEKVIAAAIERLIGIGWLEVMSDWPILCDEQEHTSQVDAGSSQGDATLYVEEHGTEREDTERNGTERHGTEPSASADSVRSVFAHYRTYHPRAFKSPKSDSKEWRLIRNRLAEGYTVEDLLAAIDGNHESPWHAGENPGGKRYHDLELIMRDGSHVQKFIEEHERGPPVVLSEKTQRGVRAGQSYLQKRLKTNDENGPSTTD